MLLDIGMPRVNGYDTARQIRQQAWGERIYLVALTGWGQAEDRRKSSEAGFDAHLVKPIDPATIGELMAVVCPAEAPARLAERREPHGRRRTFLRTTGGLAPCRYTCMLQRSRSKLFNAQPEPGMGERGLVTDESRWFEISNGLMAVVCPAEAPACLAERREPHGRRRTFLRRTGGLAPCRYNHATSTKSRKAMPDDVA